MLLLVFQIGGERYALDASTVNEVLPLVDIRPIPYAPIGIAGMFDYRGTPVPAVDLCALTVGRAAERSLSTRIVIVDYPDGAGGAQPLGVIAEKATQTIRREPSEFLEPGVRSHGAPYLGPVTRDAGGLVQRVEVTRLLPPSVREVLFTRDADQPWPQPTSPAC
jgi:chemotaxis-related protein WspB